MSKARKRYPTGHYVEQALGQMIGQTVNAPMIVAQIRKTTGQTVRDPSVSGVLARLNGVGTADVAIDRIALGLYRVERRDAAEPATPRANGTTVQSAGLKPGDLVEIVHVAMTGQTYATDQVGTLYRLTVVGE
ncbi:MAG TPA: hypothetical protein VGF65_05915 [Mycobacterium sp.]